MAAKKTTYSEIELEWAEKQLSEWRQYVDNHPFNQLVDRIEYRATKTGTMPMVVASIEAQGKFLQETMKNYLALLKEVDAMREKEAAKQVAKGDADIPARMQR